MVFRSFFSGRQKKNRPEGYEEGWKLFELGMAHASRFECSKAIDYYNRSIAICKNPAPYINRANLLGKRIRYHEALQDLQEAQRLDATQGKEFTNEIQRELAVAELVTSNYRNGIREKLLADLKQNDKDTSLLEYSVPHSILAVCNGSKTPSGHRSLNIISSTTWTTLSSSMNLVLIQKLKNFSRNIPQSSLTTNYRSVQTPLNTEMPN